jgi:hypothetical protein
MTGSVQSGLRGAHAPSRAALGALANRQVSIGEISARAPKLAREARALPGLTEFRDDFFSL